MSNQVIVHKGRTNIIEIHLGYDASADSWASEIRAEPDLSGTLICPWTVSWVTDGVDGKLKLTILAVTSGAVEVDSGYMDLKRITGGQPVPVFDRPLEVVFRGSVTA